MKTLRVSLLSALAIATALSLPGPAASPQSGITIDRMISYSFASGLVSARKADRIAWLENERGLRNVYTAAAPGFKPARLTSFMSDDGTDLSSLRISDDGAVIVFVRGHDPNRLEWVANPSHLPDGSEQAIWAVWTKEAKPFRLAAGRDPVLSPDGRMVLYVKNGQIYGTEVPAAGTPASTPGDDPPPLFRTWGRNGAPRWSPDGRKIAFVSDRESHSFIGIYEPATRRIAYLVPSVDRDTSPSWSEDGRKIAFIRRPGSPFGGIAAISASRAPSAAIPGIRPSLPAAAPAEAPKIASGPGFQESKFADGHVLTFWTADVETGAAGKVWHDPLAEQDAFRPVNALFWAGDRLVFRLEKDNWQHYFSVPASGGLDAIPVNLTPGEGEAEYIGLSSDGKILYYTSNAGDIDRRDLWASPVSGSGALQLTRGDGIETEPAPLASGTRVAVLYSDARRPRCVALVPSAGGEAEILPSRLPADFPLDAHVVPESVNLKAADGWEFHNQVFVPKDIKPGEKRPAILFTHGGPGRQMLLGYHYMYFYHMAYALNQYWAAKGYVVISVNYRSGIGYGRTFRMAPDRGRAGSSEYQDVVAAALYLQSRPDVDPDRIGLWGLSYGGLLTALGLSRNSDIFKAGVDIAGVHLWGTSLDENAVSFRSSPVATIDRWTSPVLLVHGDDDRNVEFWQTAGLVHLLRARNVPHELIIFPDEVHDFLVHEKWLRVFKAADAFFGKILGR